jgi:hypothetical protein
MKRLLRAVLGAAAAVSVVALAWACNGDLPQDPKCSNIPAGGCPSSFGPACDDPSCAAVYACTSAGWNLVGTCPARDAGADAVAGDATKDAPAPRDVDIDAPGANGGPGCQDLEPPDCTLGFGLACPAGSCCGCEDFFVCVNGGWNQWGTCGDGGAIVPR